MHRRRVPARLFPLVLAGGAALSLSACAEPPRPFARDAAPIEARLPIPVSGAVVAVPPTQNAPPAVALAVSAALARGLAAAEVPAAVDQPEQGEHRVMSSVLSLAPHPETDEMDVLLGLELRDGAGQPLMVTQVRGRVAGGLWSATARSADSAAALAEAAATLVGPALPALASAEQARVPVPEGQPLGLMDGLDPMPSPGGAPSSGPADLPRVEVLPVSGAPGGEANNALLQRAAASVLRQVGAPITADAGKADAAVAALVSITPEVEGQERIRIVWSVMTPDGTEIGTVKQENVLPRGYALRDWEDLAFLISGNAVDGLVPLLQRVPKEHAANINE
jgi:hypothetical protein